MTGMLQPRTLRWRPWQGVGLEHAVVTQADGMIRARSVVIGEREDVAYGARYELLCDESWRTRALTVERADGRTLHIASDGAGRWAWASGEALPQLDGCIDIDLSGSPLTNTLPVRRCGLTPAMGQTRFRMAYIPFNTLEPFADEQLYTALDESGRFYFEEADGFFEGELTMDKDRFVLSFPELYERC